MGLLTLEPLEGLEDVLGEGITLVPGAVTPAGVASTDVAAWIVHTPGLPPPVLQAARDSEVPAVFLVDRAEARGWLRTLRKGTHDVCWLPADLQEVRARTLGLLARRSSWSHVAGSLCRELAHDLRGPLQALAFTVEALRTDQAVAEGFEEDVDALLEASDKADLVLDGVANLGRRAREVGADAPTVEITQLLREAARRRAFGDAVVVDAGEALQVRGHADALGSALQDVLCVAWIRSAGRRQVRVSCLRFGDEGVVTVQARAYAALLDHHQALLSRERPILLRRERVPLPLAGLAYAREVAVSCGGALSVDRVDSDLRIEVRLPLA